MKFLAITTVLVLSAIPAHANNATLQVKNGEFSEGLSAYTRRGDVSISEDVHLSPKKPFSNGKDRFAVMGAGTAAAQAKWEMNSKTYLGSFLSKSLNIQSNTKLTFDWSLQSTAPSSLIALLVNPHSGETLVNLSDMFVANGRNTTWKSASWVSKGQYSGPVRFVIAQEQGSLGSSRLLLDNLQVAPVPEPETYALMAIGLLGTWAARRRNQSKKAPCHSRSNTTQLG